MEPISLPPKRGTAPNFWPMSVVAMRLPISATAEHLFEICKQTDMLITILCTPAGSKVMTRMSV